MITSGYSFIFWLIVIFILFEVLIEFVLDRRNSKSWLLSIPEILKGIYDDDKYHKAQNYHAMSERLSSIASILGIVIMLLFLFFKGFAYAYLWVSQITANEILQVLIYFGLFMVLADIIGLPFELYKIFVIEEKYGFNKMSLKMFFLDKVKSYAIGAVVVGILLSAFVWFYKNTGQYFWIYAWILFTVFSIFMTMFYTSLIVPIFNKLEPLEDGSLREKIENFAKLVSFPLTNIFIIDGSKRSTKANAYFSGLGSKKTIVLYDTLIKEHSEEELVSILAHEVGHYKMRHIQKGLVIGVLQIGIILYILSIAINMPQLTMALGFESNVPVFPLGLIAFSMLYSPVSMIVSLAMNILSRKNEFEADNYAKEHVKTGEYLIAALKKLSSNNLSNLNPDKWYVFVHYSHPPLKERIEKLLKS